MIESSVAQVSALQSSESLRNSAKAYGDAIWRKLVSRVNTSVRATAAKRRLRKLGVASAEQDGAFASLTGSLAATVYWREHGMENGMNYAAFQARVPIHLYEDISPFVDHMTRGRRDVLWPAECTQFAYTAGTSGTPKCLPMTPALLQHFRRAGSEVLLYFAARAGNSRVLHGPHLCCSGEPILTFLNQTTSAGGAAVDFPALLGRPLSTLGTVITGMSSSSARIQASPAATASPEVRLLSATPSSMTALSSLLQEMTPGGWPAGRRFEALWPNLECVAYTGASMAPHAMELESVFGPTVQFHEIYAALEGVIAVQDQAPGEGLRVLSNMGLFFEFLTVADYDTFPRDTLRLKTVPLAGVKRDVDYVLLVTTPGGLARYVLGDVVRFTSLIPPRLVVVGGLQLRLNAFRENLSERALSDALVALCRRRGWSLKNFHVAPFFGPRSMVGQQRGGHEWWIELQPGTVTTPTGPQIALQLDDLLRQSNADYASRREAGALLPPMVRLVMPGVFDHWLAYHRQRKMPRCQSDRAVADEFAQITRFAADQ